MITSANHIRLGKITSTQLCLMRQNRHYLTHFAPYVYSKLFLMSLSHKFVQNLAIIFGKIVWFSQSFIRTKVWKMASDVSPSDKLPKVLIVPCCIVVGSELILTVLGQSSWFCCIFHKWPTWYNHLQSFATSLVAFSMYVQATKKEKQIQSCDKWSVTVNL